jgi:hypothetical protein
MTPEQLTEDWREYYEERAAIHEYCGEQARNVAEGLAMVETVDAIHASKKNDLAGGAAARPQADLL